MSKEDKKGLTIALAGNPNCGKTTVFNGLTGANQHVGNYSGVTVEKRDGSFKLDDTEVKVIDLPGTYSLNSHSPEERVAIPTPYCPCSAYPKRHSTNVRRRSLLR